MLGFLVPATTAPTRGIQGQTSFNPVLGFLVPATTVTAFSTGPSTSFNPVLGFLVPATANVCPRRKLRLVSIPCWVFWFLRPLGRGRRDHRHARFQSRAGFSGSCDCREYPWELRGSSVSIPCWVFWFLRPTDAPSTSLSRHVSIPCWVFWFLRPTALEPPTASATRFNPVLGFLVPATRQTFAAVVFITSVFQSRAGFSGSCDIDLNDWFEDDAMFQSRAGFSGSCDLSERPRSARRRRFNPVLGFLVPATSCGLDGARKNVVVSIPCWVFWFLRQLSGLRRSRHDHVSIPCWVFWFLRRLSDSSQPVYITVSIPCWVFWFLRPTASSVVVWRSSVSIPCWVFWFLRHGARIQDGHWHRTVSIPCWVFWFLRHTTDLFVALEEQFQSRAGFSGSCDSRTSAGGWSSSRCFNPVLGFLVPATSRLTTS